MDPNPESNKAMIPCITAQVPFMLGSPGLGASLYLMTKAEDMATQSNAMDTRYKL